MSQYYQSPRITYELCDCAMPLTFDTYSNCSYGCIYCFSQQQRGIGASKDDYFNKQNVKFVNVEKIKRMFLEPDTSPYADYIKQRKIMQWGGLSDCFDSNEKRLGITLELLRFFREINYPLSFSTKATWWLEDSRYTELFKDNKSWHTKISIITGDDNLARKVELGVPLSSERLKAIEKLAKLNTAGVTLRLRPFIVGISTPSYLDLIENAHNAGAISTTTEFLCEGVRNPNAKKNFERLSQIAGFDLLKFYLKNRNKSSMGMYRLNKEVTLPFVIAMKNKCDELGMAFFVSDPNFKEASCGYGCCGITDDLGLKTSGGHFGKALMIAKSKGLVYFKDIENDIPKIDLQKTNFKIGSNFEKEYFRHQSFKDLLLYFWNNPNKTQSPKNIFANALIPYGKDDKGNLIYKYNGDF